MVDGSIEAYFAELDRLRRTASARDRHGESWPLAAALAWTTDQAIRTTAAAGKILFVGNGGSAAIASHMAVDYSKNGGMRALAFNDGVALTCLGNDLGYDSVFSAQIEMHGSSGDLLVAISSSGQSASILNAVAAALDRDIAVVTLSGFRADNPLRRMGDVNFFVDSDRYGLVEISHLTLVHAILDKACAERLRRAC